MKRRLIIDGNAVYELDEDCMLKKRVDKGNENEPINGKEQCETEEENIKQKE